MKRHDNLGIVTELTPYRPSDFHAEAGLEAGSGLHCLGHFALTPHLLRYRNHWMKPPSACLADLICDLAEKARIKPPRDKNDEEQLVYTLARLPSPFPDDFPRWALAVSDCHWADSGQETPSACPSWPVLGPTWGIALLARTAGGLYLASREVVYDTDWIGKPMTWFVPVDAWPGETRNAR